MDENRVVADVAMISDSLIGMDIICPVRLRYTVVLDHDIEEELIVKAWNRTKRIYPVIDTVIEADHGSVRMYLDKNVRNKYPNDHFYLVRPTSGSNNPVKSKVPVAPGSDTVGGRTICVSYYGNTIVMNVYHAVVDGSGGKIIFSSFIYSYLALYTGHEDDEPIVELTEGRETKEYYQGANMDYIFSQEYTPAPIFTLPANCRGFHDKDMIPEKDGSIYSGNIDVSYKDFMSFCKENGASPSSMMCAVMAKAAYALNPEEQNDIVFHLTVSGRKLLGLENSIANVIGLVIGYTSRDDIYNKTIGEVAKKIRSDTNTQRTRDYFLSFRRLLYTYKHELMYKQSTITYLGSFDIGDNNSHIMNFSFETYNHSTLYMTQLNDRFIITLEYGKATEKYLNALDKIFSELGIKAEISLPVHQIVNDSSVAVL